MQAIRTRLVGPRGSQGAKVNARCATGTISVSYDHTLSVTQNHAEAAKKLITKMNEQSKGGWEGQWVAGWADDDMYWVCMAYLDLTGETFTVARDPKFQD